MNDPSRGNTVIRDPFGHDWMLGQHVEEVAAAEMQRRYTELLYGA